MCLGGKAASVLTTEAHGNDSLPTQGQVKDWHQHFSIPKFKYQAIFYFIEMFVSYYNWGVIYLSTY